MPEDESTNEIVKAAKDAKARKAKSGGERGDHWPLKAIGLGVGIGSAAVTAALLYANRDKRGD